jgi:hypothetical protein
LDQSPFQAEDISVNCCIREAVMNPDLMFDPHHPPFCREHRLEPRQAVTLKPAPRPQELRVHEGRVWLTNLQSAGKAEDDIWLEAGQGRTLPPGSAWVAEGWPRARVSVHRLPQPALKPRTGSWWTWAFSLWPQRGQLSDSCGAGA